MTLGELKQRLAELGVDDDDTVYIQVGEDNCDIDDIIEGEDEILLTIHQTIG